MTSGETLHAGQRVIDRIESQPKIASIVLQELIFDPETKSDITDRLKNEFGEVAADMYPYLGQVIANAELYVEIPISELALVQATATRQEPLRPGLLDKNAHNARDNRDKLVKINRANELRAIAILAIREQKEVNQLSSQAS